MIWRAHVRGRPAGVSEHRPAPHPDSAAPPPRSGPARRPPAAPSGVALGIIAIAGRATEVQVGAAFAGGLWPP